MSETDLAAVADESETPEAEAQNEQQTEADDQPAETEAEADAQEAEAEDNDDNSDDEEAEKPKRKGKSRNQRYAERITAQAAEIAELRRKMEETTKAAPVTETPKPQLDDFDSVSEYDAALTEWAVEKALAKNNKETAAERQKEAAANSARERARAYQERMNEAKQFIPDFDDVVGDADDAPVASHVQGLVIESERAPELVYHFAKNPHVLADINQMSERDAAREIGRLEAKLVKPTPRKQSKAPPPQKPVRGAATPVKPLSELSMAEYAARREKEIYG